jgi:hypothetical protein
MHVDTNHGNSASSASLSILAAIPFALLAQLILVEASCAQFAADISSGWSLARFPVSAAVSFALLPEPVLVFAGTSQFFTLATATALVHSDAARTDLNRLGKDRCRNYKKNRRRDHKCKLAHH